MGVRKEDSKHAKDNRPVSLDHTGGSASVVDELLGSVVFPLPITRTCSTASAESLLVLLFENVAVREIRAIRM